MRSRLSPIRSACAALLLTLTCAACSGTTSFTAQSRHLSSGAILVPASAPRPSVSAGDDLGIIADKAFAYGDENAHRLLVGRCNTDDQTVQIESAGKQQRSALPECIALRKAKP